MYLGNFHEDKKCGYGVFTWPDGKVYKGFWLGGKQHGIGMYTKDGQEKCGIWLNGKRLEWCEE